MDKRVKDRLLERIRDNDDWLENKLMRANVYTAIEDDNYAVVVDYLDQLVTISIQQRKKIIKQAEEIRYLEDYIRRSEMKPRHSAPSVPPAERRDLDIKEMYAKYKELGSFAAVGKLMGCSHKTVKNRLKKAGLI